MTPPTITSLDPVAPTRREIAAKAVFDDRGEFQFAVPPLADPADFSLKGDAVEACTVVVGPSALAHAWALTDRHRLAMRDLRFHLPQESEWIHCTISAEFGGLILYATGYGTTLDEALESAIAKAHQRIAESERGSAELGARQ